MAWKRSSVRSRPCPPINHRKIKRLAVYHAGEIWREPRRFASSASAHRAHSEQEFGRQTRHIERRRLECCWSAIGRLPLQPSSNMFPRAVAEDIYFNGFMKRRVNSSRDMSWQKDRFVGLRSQKRLPQVPRNVSICWSPHKHRGLDLLLPSAACGAPVARIESLRK